MTSPKWVFVSHINGWTETISPCQNWPGEQLSVPGKEAIPALDAWLLSPRSILEPSLHLPMFTFEHLNVNLITFLNFSNENVIFSGFEICWGRSIFSLWAAGTFSSVTISLLSFLFSALLDFKMFVSELPSLHVVNFWNWVTFTHRCHIKGWINKQGRQIIFIISRLLSKKLFQT